ncbi:carboxypeptidase-like regulatory domain-containing protein [Portibacter marinus]|uniref:carboxypeptidase-like regulatory domain-containing protein n=1 Tax=Portibacter marinus TaxID=2898660 RepID=UPI001F173A1C|nr:carboxypeptidase-like regulatory domain-containing protein [Portibacter marinus]
MSRNIITSSFLVVFLLMGIQVSAQKQIDSVKVVQFSGLVVTEQAGNAVPLPYTNIGVKGTSRGTVSEMNGFFSLAGRVGETIVFSHLGYQTVEFEIPDTIQGNLYSFIQIMSQDSVLLPIATIYPWPSKEYFDIEFLAMDVSDEMRERAKENLAENALMKLREAVPADGVEAGNIYLKEQAQANYYQGQFKPQRIFDLAAWAKFIEAWKRGDFKRKKKE